MKSITIVIPNYNGMRYLPGCLESLGGQTDQDFEVLMIDNGSTDGSVEWVRAHYPSVKIRAYYRNTGFCRAVNAGIRISRAQYVLLLNNDVVCDPEMVSFLHRAMERRPGAFSCCARLLQMADPGRFLSRAGMGLRARKRREQQTVSERGEDLCLLRGCRDLSQGYAGEDRSV